MAFGPSANSRRLHAGASLPLLAVALLLTSCQHPPPPSPGGELLIVEQLVPAATGGTVHVPNGATLTIPPGAMAEDALIKVTVPADTDALHLADVYKLEPDGLTFSVPATLTIPLPVGAGGAKDEAGNPRATVFLVSDLNAPFDAGSELALFDKAEVVAWDDVAGTLSVALDHFTFLVAYNQVDELAYLVTDIPPRYLEPADLFFTLTKVGFLGSFEQDGPNWAPGHVGVFAPRAGRGVDRRFGRIVEATPPKVAESTLEDFKAEPGHLFLGAHRVAGGLTPEQQKQAVSYLDAQRGKGYAAVLGQGNLAVDAFSCVGLAESMLDSIGQGVLGVAQEALVSAPLELFRATAPVRELTLYAGEHLDFQVYGVVVDPASVGPAPPLVSPWDYYCACEYEIAAGNLPSGATFTGTEPLDHGPAGSYTYRFSWTPGAQHAGQTFRVTLQMAYKVKYLFSEEERYLADELVIRVLPLSGATVTAVELQHDLVMGDATWYEAGSVVPLDRIEGGKVVEGHAGCGDGEPHLHAEADGIYVDGIGPFPDPNPAGCGYGTIVEVPVEHLD